jgi:serine/threonine protein kinase
MASRPGEAPPEGGELPETRARSNELPETRVGAPKPSRRFHAALEVDPCPPGTIVGEKYEVTSRIGRGGMGFVVAAKHVELGHSVAIKVMHAEDVADALSVKRFLREGRAAATLKSDHAVRIYDVGRLPSGTPYLVMEHLEGSDLSAYVKKKLKLSVDEAVEYIVQATFALNEAHASGLIHRDLKPHNLFLARLSDGKKRIKVLDFGLVKETSGSDLTSTMETPSAPEGAILGSPHFMSPEQIRDPGAVDLRTDIWSLGATLFQLLTGVPPFHALTVHLLLAKILSDRAPDVRTLRSDVPEGVAHVIARCLAPDRNDRFATVNDLVRALNACGATKTLPSTRIETPNYSDRQPMIGGPAAADDALGATRAAQPFAPRHSPAPLETVGFIPTVHGETKPGLGSANARALSLTAHTVVLPQPARAPTSTSVAAVEPPALETPRPTSGARTAFGIIAVLLVAAAGIGVVFTRRNAPTPARTETASPSPPSANSSAPIAVDSPPSSPAPSSAPAASTAASTAPVASAAAPSAKTRPRVGHGALPAAKPGAPPKASGSAPDPYGWQP